ncbi:MAG TPA: lysylphosphatidylglycerol synthase transmembrane domain-containing protein, partial [Candidatus Nanoarchaeia archaeon]|nr:lysylphosphatidylglycerol synthase transmembrane domain-containing protein [Candidatus Nanoarchaeia archaeon]
DISKAYMLSKKNDADPGKTVASVVSQKIIGMAVTIVILVIGFGLLSVNVKLPDQVLIFFGLLMALSVASFLVVFYMSRSSKATKAVLNGLLIPLLSFFLRKRFNEVQFRGDAEHFLGIFHDGIKTLSEKKRVLVRPIAFYIVSVTFDISIVFFVFASLGYPIPVDRVLIVYALTGTLASIGVSFVGLTEIIMTTAYQVLSIPLAVSFSVTLLTRIVTLWFKLIAGYVTFQWASISIMINKRRGVSMGRVDGKSAPTTSGP